MFEYSSSSRFWSMPRKIVRSSGPASTRVFEPLLMRAMSCCGTGSIMSISPEISAATRVDGLPIGVKIASSTLPSFFPHQLRLRTSTVRVPGSRDFRRYGPVPLALNDAVFSMPLRLSTGFSALLSMHHFLLKIIQRVKLFGRIGYGILVTTSIVWSSIFLISLIAPT